MDENDHMMRLENQTEEEKNVIEIMRLFNQ